MKKRCIHCVLLTIRVSIPGNVQAQENLWNHLWHAEVLMGVLGWEQKITTTIDLHHHQINITSHESQRLMLEEGILKEITDQLQHEITESKKEEIRADAQSRLRELKEIQKKTTVLEGRHQEDVCSYVPETVYEKYQKMPAVLINQEKFSAWKAKMIKVWNSKKVRKRYEANTDVYAGVLRGIYLRDEVMKQ